ncbi:melatonin receptor type 1B-B-like [Stylophora pistillata]|uniref:melatonin receptor type 1B-B-like n=1 Tax=Stylophora pistillata TaxID=50429 RepID=UPI000C053A3B|nr:melatonin receptor type 1B-B-like [Stylophora pistillata]
MDDLKRLDRDLKSRETYLVVIETLVMFLVTTVAFLGNLLTLVVALRSPRLRTIPNKFIVSLALSDMLMVMPAIPLNTSVLIRSEWSFDHAMCQFKGYLGNAVAFASSETLALVSLDRFYHIVKPNDYRRLFTARRTSLMLLAAWMIAFLAQLPYVATGHTYSFHPGKTYCNQDGKEPFFITLILIFGGITMSVLSYCSFRIFLTVRAHKNSSGVHTRANVEEIKVSRILLVMVLANVICFVPGIVIETLDFVRNGSNQPRQVYLLYSITATMSSSINPIIYGA